MMQTECVCPYCGTIYIRHLTPDDTAAYKSGKLIRPCQEPLCVNARNTATQGEAHE
jgi:hypothetical protein